MFAHSDTLSVQQTGCKSLCMLTRRGVDPTFSNDLHTVKMVIRSMRSQPHDLIVQRWAVGTLLNHADRAHTCSWIVAQDGVQQVLLSMSHDDVLLERWACEVLVSLVAAGESICSVVREEGALKTIAASMRRHPRDVKMQLWGCVAMCGLTHHAPVGDTAVLEAVNEAMTRHSSNLPVQRFACLVLLNCSRQLRHGIALHSLELIIASMQTHPLDVDVQHTCCALLQNAARPKEFCERIGLLGGIGAVMTAMTDHSLNLNLQRFGCGALCNLSQCKQNQDRIRHASGVIAVGFSIHAHSRDWSVLGWGCTVLQRIVQTDFERDTISRCCVEAILDSLKSVKVGRVKESVCALLHNLSLSSEVCVNMTRLGCVPVLFEVMRDNMEDVKILCWVCAALVNHARFTPEAVGTRVVTDLVQRVMLRHPFSSLLHQWGCSFLDCLARSDELSAMIGDLGGVELVHWVTQKHLFNLKVQLCGFSALCFLTRLPGNVTWIDDVSGVDTVFDAMGAHDGDGVVQQRALRVLLNYVLGDARYVQCVRHRGLQLVVQAMAGHVTNAVIQWCGCALLQSLARTDFRSDVRGVGGITAVCNAMKAFVHDVHVQRWGCGALCNLADGSLEDGVVLVQLAMTQHKDPSVQAWGNMVLASEAAGAILGDAVVTFGELPFLADELSLIGTPELEEAPNVTTTVLGETFSHDNFFM
uniref:Armadillo repeat-containing protein 8 n=1 Tax=Noctiluca scintillans TaxID=2966 RepID=A0A7S1F768_NOCSC